MAKIAKVQEVSLRKLVPYAKNAKTHSAEQIDKLAESIKAFGFLSPCLVDKDYTIIAGHGRVLAAKKLGLTSVPCVFIEGLTEEQRAAYILADNKLTELGGWDMDLVFDELETLQGLDFDISVTGFDLPNNAADWFETRERDDTSRQEGNEEYNEFLEKFEDKKTTDDCYTPEVVYNAVADWVAKEYHLDKANFVRPFYPGGDYQAERYKPSAVVVDNPPFSILAEILTFYKEKGVKFFLFAPTLTLFSASAARNATSISVDTDITYENGAVVNTSFITNLEPSEIMFRTAPDLYESASNAARSYARTIKEPAPPKYTYPNHIITSAMVAKWSRYGINFSLRRSDCVQIAEMDAQKAVGRAIYGKGFLLSNKAAKAVQEAREELTRRSAIELEKEERAAYVWELSDRERAIVDSLGGGRDE